MTSSRNMSQRADDRIVNLLSHWLARHIGDDELRCGLEEVGTADLGDEQAEAVDELLDELGDAAENRGEAEKLVRETLEAVALGG